LTYTYETTTSRLKSVLDAKSQTTTYSYNLDDTLAGITYTNSQYLTPNVAFEYESNYQRLSTVRQGTGTAPYPIQYSYNYLPIVTGSPSLGLGATQINTITGPLGSDTVKFTYDELGRVLNSTVNNVGNTVTYDALGRVVTTVNPLGTFGYFYVNQTNRLDYVNRPGGQKVQYAYYGNTGNRWLSEIKNLGPTPTSAVVSKFNYSYDAVGNILNWTQQNGTSPAQYYDLGYDRADELLSANLRDVATGNLVMPYTYRYDGVGNRTSEQADSSVSTMGYNNLNQITGVSGGGALTIEGTVGEPAIVKIGGKTVPVNINNRFRTTVQAVSGANSIPIVATDGSGNPTPGNIQFTVSVPARTFTYDFNGNLTSDGVKTYEWDAANRLIAINYTGSSNRTEFSYDGLGQRVQILEKTGVTVNSTKKFLWVKDNPVEERDASNNVIKRFFREGEQMGAGNYLFNRDHLGSIRQMVNADNTGLVRAAYAYDPYGRRTKLAGDLEADWGFTGHYFHGPSSYTLTLYRVYNADAGRWLSRDPIGESGGIDLYGYVDNNPINRWDILGLLPGQQYRCMDSAAIWALYEINAKSQKEGLEYAGTIYQNPNGTYSYTAPEVGTPISSYSGPAPAGTKEVAAYHTHPATPGYEWEKFSLTDMNSSDRNSAKNNTSYPEYMESPSQTIRKYTPAPQPLLNPWKGTVKIIWTPKKPFKCP
jgi:RHS repeat-associated protein